LLHYLLFLGHIEIKYVVDKIVNKVVDKSVGSTTNKLINSSTYFGVLLFGNLSPLLYNDSDRNLSTNKPSDKPKSCDKIFVVVYSFNTSSSLFRPKYTNE
jgi:hypothetical protein